MALRVDIATSVEEYDDQKDLSEQVVMTPDAALALARDLPAQANAALAAQLSHGGTA